MIKQYCYCKKCGNKIYDPMMLCLTTIPPKYVAQYYCERCGDHQQIPVDETYMEDTEKIKEEKIVYPEKYLKFEKAIGKLRRVISDYDLDKRDLFDDLLYYVSAKDIEEFVESLKKQYEREED